MSEHGNIKFWQEIGRRNVLRVAAVYVGFAWAVVHSGVVVGEALELPHWIMRLISGLLIVGFPAVVAFAWVYEITPEGLKRTVEVEKDASLTHRTAQRLNVVIIALMIVLAGLYGADRFLMPHEAVEGTAHATAEALPNAAVATGGISIAVLPFVNLSGDPSQEFFSDGMTEEITSALAKVKGLQVVGRTSAFEFKGQNKDLRTIGQALGATNLLEGSVRKAGNRVRITGQLIRTDSGRHIWTENYDRELTDIFKTQDDIAQAIAAALQVPLGLKQGESLVVSRTADPGVHEEYLRARAIFRARPGIGGGGQRPAIRQTIETMESLVARAPDYAPAWALLAMSYAGEPSLFPNDPDLREHVELYLPKAEAAGRRAFALDPGSADSSLGLAYALQGRGKLVEADDLYKKALALDPFNPDLLHFYAQALEFSGRITEAVGIRRRLLSLEPLSPNLTNWARPVLYQAGDYEGALSLARNFQGGNSYLFQLLAYIALNRGGEAADAILAAPAGAYPPEQIAAAVKLLRAPPSAAVPRDLPDFTGNLTPVFMHIGAGERFFLNGLAQAETGLAAGYYYPRGTLWGMKYPQMRKTERFKAYVRKTGLVDYWRARGWPDVCHPVGKDDFTCE